MSPVHSQAGKKDKRIKIIRPVITNTSFGGGVGGNSVLATVWASIRPASGGEVYAAQQRNSHVTHKICINHRAGVKSNQLIWFGLRTFQVQFLLNPQEANVDLELMCIERADSAREGRGIATPGAPAVPAQQPKVFTADGISNVFTLDSVPTRAILVWWNGLLQTAPDDYTLTDADITMVLTPSAGDRIVVVLL